MLASFWGPNWFGHMSPQLCKVLYVGRQAKHVITAVPVTATNYRHQPGVMIHGVLSRETESRCYSTPGTGTDRHARRVGRGHAD
jgi:hypothetical protein